MAKPKEPKEPKELTFFDLLRPIMKRLIKTLKRLANVKTQARLAKLFDSSVDANTVSRYKHGVVPLLNLPAMCASVGLTAGETGWMIGKLLVEANEEHAFDFDAPRQPAEVREPATPYDGRNLEDELAAVMELDLSVLTAEEMFEYARERNALHEACGELQSEIEGLDRKKAAHLELLFLFRTRAEKAICEALSRARQ